MAFLRKIFVEKIQQSHPSCTAGVSVCPRISSGEINPEPSISISLKSRRASPTGEFRKQYEWNPKDKVKTQKKNTNWTSAMLCCSSDFSSYTKKTIFFRFSKLSNSLSLFSFNQKKHPVTDPYWHLKDTRSQLQLLCSQHVSTSRMAGWDGSDRINGDEINGLHPPEKLT